MELKTIASLLNIEEITLMTTIIIGYIATIITVLKYKESKEN